MADEKQPLVRVKVKAKRSQEQDKFNGTAFAALSVPSVHACVYVEQTR